MAWNKKELQRSVCCDRRLVQIRKTRRLTQANLAEVSGYSVRLISKAESGKPISIATVEDIAEALSTEDAPVSIEDLISSPLTLARNFIFGMYQYEGEVVSTLADMIHDEIEVKFAGDPNEIPFAGVYRGRNEVERAFRFFFELLQTPENHDPEDFYEFVAEGDRVVCWGESWFHPRGGPLLEKAVDLAILMRFQQGRLIMFDDRFNTSKGSKVMSQFLNGNSPEE